METIANSVFESEEQQHAAIRRLSYAFELERRDFLKVLGGGVLVCLAARNAAAQESGRVQHATSNEDLPDLIAAWLHISEDSTVTVYTGKVEIGQNIRTSLSQQVAEELCVPLSSVRLTMADTELTPFDMGTFGSRTTPIMGRRLRIVAVAARNLLLDKAAEQLHADRNNLVVADGKIRDPKSNRTISYGELTRGQQLTHVIGDDPPTTPTSDWHIAGNSAPKVDARAFVTGEHKYTPDLVRPGMLYGKVLRPNAFHATLVSLDASDPEKISGVKVVRDGEFVGVVAPDEHTATQAVEALRAKWNALPQPSDPQLFDHLKTKSAQGSGERNLHVTGSIEKAMAAAHKKIAQMYTVAYIAHSPLEPRAAVAEWTADKLTVWTGTQRPFGVQEELAEAFRIPKEKVRVIVPDTGAAYGGKHMGDAAVEAARLAKAAGKPVKLVWTREEEFTWAYFRPAGVIDVKCAATPDIKISAWEFHNYNSGPAGINTPYDVPNQHIQFHPADSPLRQGSYRGLAATANHFVRESAMDELAHELAIDPLEFRLKNLTDARLRAVFEAAAKKFGWGKEKSSATRGFGIAGGIEKGGYIAICAEVEAKNREIRITRVAAAFECGAIVNSNGLRNQIEGSIVQAIGGALFEAIHFDNGRILNPHFAQYRVPRFSDTPQIEVEMLDRKDLPSAGAGETPIVGLAPAVGNAIFAATGIRLRSLPMIPQGLPQSHPATGQKS
jgi:CO/xanthine dehydrogenase Mo-binding subunit